MNDRLLDLLGLDDPQPSSNQGEPEIIELEEDVSIFSTYS